MAIQYKDLPGPKGAPIVGSAFQLDIHNMHNQIENWSKEYGGVFQLNVMNKDITCITDPKVYQHILRDRPDKYIRMSKMDRIIREGGVHGVFNAEGEEWSLHRKIVAKGLDVKHQKEFFPNMLVTLERLYHKWKRNADNGDIIDIQQDFLRFTVDITTSMAFGVDMNTLEEKGGVIQNHMEKIFPMIFKRMNQPIAWYRLFKSKADRAYEKAIEEVFKLVAEFIQAGRKQLAERPELREQPENLLQAILVAAEEEGEEFTDEQVRGNLMTILMAGEDTTAHTMAWATYLLAQRDDIQEELRSEADEVLGEDKWFIDHSLQHKFPYIEGVTNETMRIKPVAPMLIFEPTQDVEIEGYAFKSGAHILVQTRAGAMNDEFFTAAQEMNPRRWMKASKCPVHNMDAFAPFGGGPRYCPGRNLAYLEIKMVFAMLFKNFNLEMVTKPQDVREIMAFTMMASPFEVKLTHRN